MHEWFFCSISVDTEESRLGRSDSEMKLLSHSSLPPHSIPDILQIGCKANCLLPLGASSNRTAVVSVFQYVCPKTWQGKLKGFLLLWRNQSFIPFLLMLFVKWNLTLFLLISTLSPNEPFLWNSGRSPYKQHAKCVMSAAQFIFIPKLLLTMTGLASRPTHGPLKKKQTTKQTIQQEINLGQPFALCMKGTKVLRGKLSWSEVPLSHWLLNWFTDQMWPTLQIMY